MNNELLYFYSSAVPAGRAMNAATSSVSIIYGNFPKSASYSFKSPMLIKARLQIFLIASILLLCLSALAQKANNTEFFSNQNFYKDTLYIKARFMECGEWGGHLELAKVFLKEDDLHLSYQKYKADCSKIKDNNGEPVQILEKSIERKLSEKDKQLIKQYACLLIAAKFREPAPMNAGYIFEMKNVEETLNIHVYTWGQLTKDEYLNFISKLRK